MEPCGLFSQPCRWFWCNVIFENHFSNSSQITFIFKTSFRHCSNMTLKGHAARSGVAQMVGRCPANWTFSGLIPCGLVKAHPQLLSGHTPRRGSRGPRQPRHVHWLGVQPATSHSAGRCPVKCARQGVLGSPGPFLYMYFSYSLKIFLEHSVVFYYCWLQHAGVYDF